MLTNKQKVRPILAFMVFSASLIGLQAIFELACETNSRGIINAAYVLTVLGSSTGLLVAALIIARAFRSQPLFPEFPLWMKLCTFYATCMVATGVLSFVFTGDTWQDRMDRRALEQTSNVIAINVAMILVGLAWFGAMWITDLRNSKKGHDLHA